MNTTNDDTAIFAWITFLVALYIITALFGFKSLLFFLALAAVYEFILN